MSFYWFGDSWVNGDELNNEVSGNTSKYTYARLVSDHFGEECNNYSTNASSIYYMVVQLKSIIHKIKENDVIFFGITGGDRFVTLSETYEPQHMTIAALVDDHRIAKHNEIWYKYFDTIPQRDLMNSNALDLLKAYSGDAKSYFYNIFHKQQFNECLLLSDDDWLIPSDDCLASNIMHVFDNKYYTFIGADQPFLSNDEWKKHSELIDKYFKPNYAHPNIKGHQMLAERIINLL